MKQFILVFIALIGFNFGFSQKIVDNYSDVKNPKNGKLYFSEKENNLSLFGNGKFNKIYDLGGNPEPPKPPIDSLVYIGYWDVAARELKAMLFSDGYYLIQTDGNYIVPRGKNLLKDPKTKITSGFDLDKIKSGNSELGGLFHPGNFPAKELISRGYKLNSNGEYVKGDFTDPEPEKPAPGEPVGLKTIPEYPKPSSWNTEVFAQFPNFKLPKNIVSVGGYGFPLFKDTKLDDKGKVNLLNQGFTNLVNLNALERSKWADNVNGQWTSDAYYYFQQAYHLTKEASKSMRRQNKPEWGSLDDRDSDPRVEDYNYSGLTVEGAKEMGRHMVQVSNSVDDTRWNIDATGSVLMIDEESIRSHPWQYGSHYDFLGYVKQGINEASKGKQKVFLYAQPISRWFHKRHGQFYDLTDNELLEALNPSNITMGSTWNGMKWYTDANGSYYKVPFLSKTNLYKKDGSGNFLLKDGKRVFRDDNSTINTYLSTDIPILNQPEDHIKWYGTRPDGSTFLGWQKKWGDYNSRDMTFSLPAGWEWHGVARPYRAGWQGEYELFVEGAYYKADAVMQDLLLLAFKEKGEFDAFTPNQNYLLYVEHRPVTEPWTTYGNSTKVREIGDGFIFFDTFLASYSGAKGLSTWDDGRYIKDNLASNGNTLYWDDVEHKDKDGKTTHYTRDNWKSDWTRYHARISAIQQAFRDLGDTDAYSWKHIHFYQPYFGRKNKEVISSGIYFEGKLHVFFLNPSLENGEKQDLTLRIGGTSYNVTLDGHEFYYQTFDAPDGLNPKDFTLEYTTILGKKTKVTGLVTDKLSDHYLE